MGLYRPLGLRPRDGTNPCASLSWVMGLYRPLCLRPGGRRKPMYIIVMALMGLYRTFGLRPRDDTNPWFSR